jgi:hypothetical protein
VITSEPLAPPPASGQGGSSSGGEASLVEESHAMLVAEPEPEPELAPASSRRRRTAARPAPARHATDDAFWDDLDRGVKKLGEHRYEIKSSALALAQANLGKLAHVARVAPDVREGKPVGFRLLWVKADGPIAGLGLRSDDVLVSVNGLDISTPDHVLDAYGKLKEARLFELGVVRDGRATTFEYAIR